MIDRGYFRVALEAERDRLEKELAEVGKRNPANPADWVATPEDLNNLPADRNEMADTLEGLGEHAAILADLETEYNEVKSALVRLEEGTYGTCEECGGEIPEERLRALPAARMCLAHNPS